MIRNEIVSSNDVPDEYHQHFSELTDEIIELLAKVAEKAADPRIFLSAVSLSYSGLLAILLEQIEDVINREEYLKTEMEVFLKNVEVYTQKLKKTPGI